MKKTLFSLLTLTLLISTTSARDYTETKTYTKNTCPAGYHALKVYLKDKAKRTCVKEQGSHGLMILKHKKWTKISCTKNKKKHEKTTVTVKGTFSATCR